MLNDFLKLFRRIAGRKFTSGKRPISCLNAESARLCNLECLQCATHASEAKRRSNCANFTTGTMSVETFSKIIPILDQVEALNLDNHGEPLLNKNLEKIISLARTSAPHIRITMTSNFIRMNRDRAISILQSGLDGIQVSVNGVTKQTYEKIMRGARYEKLLENLSTFSEVKSEIPNQLTTFSACMTTMRSNIDELIKLPAFLSEFGINLIRINSLLPFSPYATTESLFDEPKWQSRLEKIYEKTVQEAQKYNIQIYHVLTQPKIEKCRYPVQNLSVSFDGEICPCWMLDLRDGYDFYYKGSPITFPFISFGNVNEKEILEIWNSIEFVSYRNQFKAGKLPSYCEMCPVGQGLICG